MASPQFDKGTDAQKLQPRDWLYLQSRQGLYGVLRQLFANKMLARLQPWIKFRHAAIAVLISGVLYFGTSHVLSEYKLGIMHPSRCSQARSAQFPSAIPVKAVIAQVKCLEAEPVAANTHQKPADTAYVSSSDAWGYRLRRAAFSLAGWMLFLSFMFAALLWGRDEKIENSKALFGEDSDEYQRATKLEIPQWQPAHEADDWLVNPPDQSSFGRTGAGQRRPVFGRKPG